MGAVITIGENADNCSKFNETFKKINDPIGSINT
jgi:hypothetical protein